MKDTTTMMESWGRSNRWLGRKTKISRSMKTTKEGRDITRIMEMK
jgi:hypothetical protein